MQHWELSSSHGSRTQKRQSRFQESGRHCLASIVQGAATEASSDNVIMVRVNRERCSQNLTILGYVVLGVNMCIACNEVKGLTECPMCSEVFPRMETEQCTLVQGKSPREECLNVHALGERWIEKVTDARVSGRSQNEGEYLDLRTHIRGWEMEDKKS